MPVILGSPLYTGAVTESYFKCGLWAGYVLPAPA